MFPMKRRNALRLMSGGIIAGTAYYLLPGLADKADNNQAQIAEVLESSAILIAERMGGIDDADDYVKDSLDRVKNFDSNFSDDIFLEAEKLALLQQTVARMERVQRLVGYANFSLLRFDDMLRYAKNYSDVGSFSKQEKDFVEEIFFADASKYGFLGNKVITELTAKINKTDTVKVPRTGHYLFKGEPLQMYSKLRKDVGDSLVLTSGVRGVVKQIHLFLSKAKKTDGNLSRASRSLAPPGHSYHGVGDFDVGKVNFGEANFTSRFADTVEYKKLVELGYVEIRYPSTNRIGVRYEPWHIKVV